MRRSLMTSLIYCSQLVTADIKRNSNSRTFSRNIQFEVKYLENGLVFHMRATCIFLVVAL